jgi:hypothetical protein
MFIVDEPLRRTPLGVQCSEHSNLRWRERGVACKNWRQVSDSAILP